MQPGPETTLLLARAFDRAWDRYYRPGRATIAPEDQGLVIEPAPPREQGSTYRPELAHEKPRPKKKPRMSKQA